MDTVPREKHPYHSTTPPRCHEPHCRCGVSDNARQARLEAEPRYIPEDRPDTGSTGSGSICVQTDNSVPSLFQLTSRSLRSSYRCLPAGLVAIEGLCQPPMVPNREGTSPGANPTSTDSPPGTSLEDSAMVPTPTVDGSGMLLPSQGGHGDHAQPGQSTNDTNSTSRIEYLRKRYRDQELSEEAIPLSCSNHGGKRPISLTTHSSADGIAGVIEGKLIPFLVL